MSARRGGEDTEVRGYTTRGATWEWWQSWFLVFFLTGFLYWLPLVYMGLRVLEFRWVIYGLFYAGPAVLLSLALMNGGVEPLVLKHLWQAAGGFFLMAGIHTLRARGEFLVGVSEQLYEREEQRERERAMGKTDRTLPPGQPARLLNVNRLSEIELAMLPGLGPERAQQALRMRAAMGDFLSLADFAAKMQLSKETRHRLEPLFEPDSGAMALALAKDEPAYRTMPDGSRVLELNWASVETLAQLPGVSPELAQRAVSLRDADGPFKSMEDFRFRLALPMDTLVRLAPFAQCNSMSLGPAGAAKPGGRIVDV